MKRVLIAVLVCWGLYTCHARADTTTLPPVTVTVPPTVTTVVNVVKNLDPSAEYVFLFKHPSFLGTSASVMHLTSRHYPIASLRIGFEDSQPVTTPYLSESFDLPGIAERFTPETVKGYLTNPLVDSALRLVGKYGRVGLVEGYDFSRGKLITGLSVGASFVATF